MSSAENYIERRVLAVDTKYSGRIAAEPHAMTEMDKGCCADYLGLNNDDLRVRFVIMPDREDRCLNRGFLSC